jgi:hypothetical protein
MVGNDVIGDIVEPLRGFHHLGCINRFHFYIRHTILLFDGSDIFDRELQDIFIPYRIGYHILMQTLIEEILGRAFAKRILGGVVGKNRSTGEAEHLYIIEKFLMRLWVSPN